MTTPAPTPLTTSVIKFAELKWESFVAKTEKPEAVIYQIVKLDLINQNYDFIVKQDDDFYYRSPFGNLIKMDKNKDTMVFCRIPQLVNHNSFTSINSQPSIPDVYFVDRWYIDKLAPVDNHKLYSDLTTAGKIRAVVYSDIARACLRANISYDVYESLMQNMPSCEGLKERAILDKAYKFVAVGFAVRYTTKGGEVKFLTGSGHRDIYNVEYLCGTRNEWLAVEP